MLFAARKQGTSIWMTRYMCDNPNCEHFRSRVGMPLKKAILQFEVAEETSRGLMINVYDVCSPECEEVIRQPLSELLDEVRAGLKHAPTSRPNNLPLVGKYASVMKIRNVPTSAGLIYEAFSGLHYMRIDDTNHVLVRHVNGTEDDWMHEGAPVPFDPNEYVTIVLPRSVR